MNKILKVGLLLFGVIVLIYTQNYVLPDLELKRCSGYTCIREEYPDESLDSVSDGLRISGSPSKRYITYIFMFFIPPELCFKVEFGAHFSNISAVKEDVIIKVYNCTIPSNRDNVTWNNTPLIGTEIGNFNISVAEFNNSYYVLKYLDITDCNVANLFDSAMFALVTTQDILIKVGATYTKYIDLFPHVRYTYTHWTIPSYFLLIIIESIGIISVLLSITRDYYRRLQKG